MCGLLMESISLPPQPQLMNALSTRLTPTLHRFPLTSTTTTTAFNLFAAASAVSYSTTTSTITTEDHHPLIVPDPVPPLRQKTKAKVTTGKARGSKVISEVLLKENWLNSLSCPWPTCSETETNVGSNWVLGIDPDVSGALAVLKPEGSVEVFDSPHLKVLVGKRQRKRLDTKSIVQLIQSFNAPIGTTAYIEQSIPFPQDGKQGWWSGGFGYGLWIGILVASGISVVPVPSFVWKNELKLSGSRSSKDDCRELASTLFPSTSSMLKRKKDHGRAEALLIAAYGKSLKTSDSSCMVDNMVPQKLDPGLEPLIPSAAPAPAAVHLLPIYLP